MHFSILFILRYAQMVDKCLVKDRVLYIIHIYYIDQQNNLLANQAKQPVRHLDIFNIFVQ